jgi:hypothetical protein
MANYDLTGTRNAQVHIKFITLSLGSALLPQAQAATTPAEEHLLEQVRLGEASQREDLVRQSLYRLELIDPNNPELIAARMRYLLRQGDTAGAQKQLDGWRSWPGFRRAEILAQRDEKQHRRREAGAAAGALAGRGREGR